MTEDQAKTKWCPFARVMWAAANGDAIHGLPAGNRTQSDGQRDNRTPHASMCVASVCMAWRAKPRGLGLSEGYCGLAGRL